MIKKIIVFILLISTPFITLAYLKGDVNGDNQVNAMDYVLVRNHMLKIKLLTGNELKRADVDGKNGVDVMDYVSIRNIILSNINATPEPTITPIPTTKPTPKPTITPTSSSSGVLTANFIIQDVNGVTSSYTTKSCTLKNGNNNCEIVAPILKEKTGYTAIGWNMDKNATTASVSSSSKITLKKDVTYYSISRKNDALVASFTVTTTNDTVKKECYKYNGNENCTVKTPTADVDSNSTFIGWSTSKNSTSASVHGEKKLRISKNIDYYSVIKKTITITFSVNENITNSDITKSNIKAEKLSFYSSTCDSYNNKGCNITWIPTIYSKGNYVHGFSKTKDGDTISVAKTVFKDNTTLYARIYNYYKDWNIKKRNIRDVKTYGNIVLEIDESIQDKEAQYMLNYLDVLYLIKPQLFYFNGKILFLSKEEYVSLADGKEDDAGTTTGKNGYSYLFIAYNSSHSQPVYCSTMTHELGHAYDREIKAISGGLISERDDLKNEFDKYKTLESSKRPLRDYAYNNRKEFWAVMVEQSIYKYLEDNQMYYDNNGVLTHYYPMRSNSLPIDYEDEELIRQDPDKYKNILYDLFNNYMKEGLDYYKKIGRIK